MNELKVIDLVANKRRIAVEDPDYYYKTQHTLKGNRNENDLYHGHQIVIKHTGFWGGKRHYGVFALVFNRITGSSHAINVRKDLTTNERTN